MELVGARPPASLLTCISCSARSPNGLAAPTFPCSWPTEGSGRPRTPTIRSVSRLPRGHRPGAAGHQRSRCRRGDHDPGRRDTGTQPRDGSRCDGPERRAVARGPSIERRATFALEVARCYDLRHEDTGVLVQLLTAEREAPEDMRHNVLARDLVRGLLRRARPSLAPQVRELAERIELFD